MISKTTLKIRSLLMRFIKLKISSWAISWGSIRGNRTLKVLDIKYINVHDLEKKEQPYSDNVKLGQDWLRPAQWHTHSLPSRLAWPLLCSEQNNHIHHTLTKLEIAEDLTGSVCKAYRYRPRRHGSSRWNYSTKSVTKLPTRDNHILIESSLNIWSWTIMVAPTFAFNFPEFPARLAPWWGLHNSHHSSLPSHALNKEKPLNSGNPLPCGRYPRKQWWFIICVYTPNESPIRTSLFGVVLDPVKCWEVFIFAPTDSIDAGIIARDAAVVKQK